MEQWRSVRGYEGYYEVSDQGRVRSLTRECRFSFGRTRTIGGQILRPTATRTRLDGKSRIIVTLSRNNVQRRACVPQLVLEAFHGRRPSLHHESRHLDCDVSNNRSVNLAWGTRAENHADTLRLDHVLRGERNRQAKLTDEQVRQIRDLRIRGISGPKIAARFGISPDTVYAIAKREAWTHV